MKIIKLHTIESTNDFLKQLSASTNVEDFTVVIAENQTKGKGQMGAVWESKAGENLTFSVYLNTSFLAPEKHFMLNVITSLSLQTTLRKFLIPDVKIKWPNDILSANQKVCGILIESNLKNRVLDHVIIGVGLNVNQLNFNPEFKASSLKSISGIHYDLDEILASIIQELKFFLYILKRDKVEELRKLYGDLLFRKNKPSTFLNAEGEMFLGFIKDVSNQGKLQILLEDEILKEFDIKQVKLLY